MSDKGSTEDLNKEVSAAGEEVASDDVKQAEEVPEPASEEADDQTNEEAVEELTNGEVKNDDGDDDAGEQKEVTDETPEEKPDEESDKVDNDLPVPEPVADEEPTEPETNGPVEAEEDAPEPEVNGEDSEFQFHPAFQGAGAKPGLEIWRIEQFEPVKRDPKTYGQFYSGDAYIILKTTKYSGRSKLNWDVHFWLGKSCAQDESGTAAIRTVELDEYLGGFAVQFREVQGHESKQFLSYFKKGIRYFDGGVASGFNVVDPDAYEKRLFQCKGKHTIRVAQVEVKCASLNRGDVFILDDGPNMYVWVGPQSSRTERIKALEMARQIRDEEKAGRAVIKVIEEDWSTNKEFFDALGSRDKIIRSALPDEEEHIVRKEGQDVLLYRMLETDDGKANYIEVSERPLKKELLDPRACYVLEAGTYGGIFLWTGKDCSGDFKKKVWQGCNHFIDTRGYPDWVTVTRVIDGGESPLFKQYFDEWDEIAVPVPAAAPESNVAEQSYEGVDGETLHTQKAIKTEEFVPEEEGEATLKVWRVQDYELIPVDERAYGVFFGGDSYVIQYSYISHGQDQHIIYFWQGANSTVHEQGSSALHAMNLDDNLGGKAIQIRVVMNKEPAHFLKIFGGHLVVFMHGHVTGFKDMENHPNYNPGATLMFHVRSQGSDAVRAFEVTSRGASLNSNDVFLILTPKRAWIWSGEYCSPEEVEMAEKMVGFMTKASKVRRDVQRVEEGRETLVFWNDLGGEEKYFTGPKKEVSLNMPARLFHCSNSSGRFIVQEVPDFNMEDLVEEDVMILDTYDEIFIWVGRGASEFEKKEAYKTSYTYINSDPTGRTADNTLIIVVRQGYEPPSFTGHFVPWDADRWNQGKTFEELVAEVGEENVGISTLKDEKQKYYSNYSYDELKRKFPPEGVDVTKREAYLTDEDFETVFGISKEQFYALPTWKRNDRKKAVQLF